MGVNNNSIFGNFNLDNNLVISNVSESIYEVICKQFDKIVNKYTINQEIHSDAWWKILNETFKIKETNIWTETEVSIDNKQKEHKYYKYIIRLNNSNIYTNETIGDRNPDGPAIFFVFYDELRNLEDSDYLSTTTDEEKTDKISNLIMYYDSQDIPTSELEELVLNNLKAEKALHAPDIKNQFFTIGVDSYGYQLQPAKIREFDVNIELNYGKDFIEIDKKIVDKLKNEHHGLFLLHGEPGTGKTTYIRRLISEISETKTLIYVPSYLMETIADPSFMSFLSGFKESILLLEDSEAIIAGDYTERTQAVSNILNICDGLLGDDMKIQIISTFNVNKKKIDKALTRAGRLMVDYEFKKLKPVDANILAKSVNIDRTFTESVSLAEIYQGHNQIIDIKDEVKIGF